MNEPDPILRELDRVAADLLQPGLAQRVLARRRRRAPAWGFPALVAAAACGLSSLLFWTSARTANTAETNIAQWQDMADTAKDLAP
jgi:hypothetical protein